MTDARGRLVEQLESLCDLHLDLVSAVGAAAIWAEATSEDRIPLRLPIADAYAHELDVVDAELGSKLVGWISLSASTVGEVEAGRLTVRARDGVATMRRRTRVPEPTHKPTGFLSEGISSIACLHAAYEAWAGVANVMAPVLAAAGRSRSYSEVWNEVYIQPTYRYVCQAGESLTGAYRDAVEAMWRPVLERYAQRPGGDALRLSTNVVWKWVEALSWGRLSAESQQAVLASLEPEFGEAVRRVRLGIARGLEVTQE
ncbi:hypothetical protein [Mycolicibacterium fortuitum]|uniref:hypothetical protein n=1 Tax=Mycolicibacterium fortuitum TaxID=1766 RepID=UPI00262D698D|nr:hypothetical protein [Mycolicibacterium fortuitum]